MKFTSLCRAVSISLALCLLTGGMAQADAPKVCSDGRSSLQDIADRLAQMEQSKRFGKMWNRLVRINQSDAVFYVVFEKSATASVYVFYDDCTVTGADNLPSDKVLAIIGKTDRASAFGDKGI